MNNQKILQDLAEIECTLFYRVDGSDDAQGVAPEDLRKAHKMARDLLEFWHAITGEVLE